MRITIGCCVLLVASCGEDDPGGNRNPPQPIQYTIGGTVTGLQGSGLVLQNDGADDLAISADGAFTFASSVPTGSAYAVTVQTQPSSPNQICTVANGTGTATSNVTNVAVTCATDTYTIGGTVTGLTSTGLVLQNNGGDDLTVTAAGAFTFATPVADGSNFLVTVLTQPSGPPPQFCTVTGGTGTVSGADVTSVAIACSDDTYSVGGTVTGLAGTGLVLQNNGGDDLPISANGAFTFATPVAAGAGYLVTVLTQPTSPAQTCSVANGFGSVHDDHITDVVVTCSTETYTVGGTVVGLLGTGFVLQNNGADNLAIDADGAFTFATPVADGSDYHVTVFAYPNNPVQNCSISNAVGTIDGANVTNVDIACPVPAVTPSVTASIKTLHFSWNDVGAAYYRLLGRSDASSPISQIGSDIFGTSVDLPISVHLLDWQNAIYQVHACNAADQCTGANADIEPAMIDAIGYFKGSVTTGTPNFGTAVALSGDGATMAVGAPGDDQNASAAGVVYIFRLTASGWAEEDMLTGRIPQQGDSFGDSVSLSADGNTLAVGAPGEEPSASALSDDHGAVYVFTRTGTTWSEQERFLDSNILYPEAGDRFGCSVSLSSDGNVLAAGAVFNDRNAMGFDNGITDNAGAAYVFERDTGNWNMTGFVKALNAEADDRFGAAVSLSGDGLTLAVGAYREDGDGTAASDNSAENSGAAYIFVKGTTWTQNSQQAYLKASNVDDGDNFGTSITLSENGDFLAVGAPEEDSDATGIDGDGSSNTMAGSGAVYCFSRATDTWSHRAYVKSEIPAMGDRFGYSLSLNADGTMLAVGAFGEDSAGVGVGEDTGVTTGASGAAYLFDIDWGASEWQQSAFIKATNTEGGDKFGNALDLDATGETLAVSAYEEESNATGIGGDASNNDAPHAGAVYLY